MPLNRAVCKYKWYEVYEILYKWYEVYEILPFQKTATEKNGIGNHKAVSIECLENATASHYMRWNTQGE